MVDYFRELELIVWKALAVFDCTVNDTCFDILLSNEMTFRHFMCHISVHIFCKATVSGWCVCVCVCTHCISILYRQIMRKLINSKPLNWESWISPDLSAQLSALHRDTVWHYIHQSDRDAEIRKALSALWMCSPDVWINMIP